MTDVKFKKDASKLIDVIQKRLPDATYISLLLFRKGELLTSINNNYNGWADNYNVEDMEHDNIFHLISHNKGKSLDSAIYFWNSIPDDSSAAQEVSRKRIEYGLYNGVTLLVRFDDSYTLGINITSNNQINEDVFYSRVILKRKHFMSELQKSIEVSS